MLRRFAFLPACLFFLGGLSWWSFHSTEATSREVAYRCPSRSAQGSCDDRRRDLVEWLDREVAYQHYYHQLNGRFTRLLGRVGLPLPPMIEELYEIRVTEAGSDRLRIVAVSDSGSNAEDLVIIDEKWNLRANFPLPPPRPELLKFTAWKALRQIRNGRPTESAEKTAYRGFFRYETSRDSQDRIVATALGIRPPVEGLRLELGPEGLTGAQEDELATAALAQNAGMTPLLPEIERGERERLARRIFEGELGRAAESLQEVNRWVSLGRVEAPASEREPAGTGEALEIVAETHVNVAKTQGNNHLGALVIESVSGDN
jgi:hypothetical protein